MTAFALAHEQATGQPCWSGALDARTAPAEPRVLGRKPCGRSVIIGVCGALTAAAAGRLAQLVAIESARPGMRIVYLALSSTCGELGPLLLTKYAIQDARRRVAVIAFLDLATGPVLWLASHCDMVFAAPASLIGWTHCGGPDGCLDPLLTARLAQDLAKNSNRASADVWCRLVHWHVNGEQAEAMGLIEPGSLKRDVYALARIEPNGGAT